jgi:hypothetical protein
LLILDGLTLANGDVDMQRCLYYIKTALQAPEPSLASCGSRVGGGPPTPPTAQARPIPRGLAFYERLIDELLGAG